MSSIDFAYDFVRGGFLLQFGSRTRKRVRPLFGGLMAAHIGADDRIEAIESFWDHGGLPLRSIHGSRSVPEGIYRVDGGDLRVDSFFLQQSNSKLAIWFSIGDDLPRDHWKREHDKEMDVVAWFSSRKVRAGWPVPGLGGRSECALLAGLTVAFTRTMATYPITSVNLAAEDFK